MNETLINKVRDRATAASDTTYLEETNSDNEVDSLLSDFGWSRDMTDKVNRIFERILQKIKKQTNIPTDESMAKNFLKKIIRLDPGITKEKVMIVFRYLISKCDYITMSPLLDALANIVQLSDRDFERLKKKLCN